VPAEAEPGSNRSSDEDTQDHGERLSVCDVF
jgi:hypothetical protein